MPDTNLITEHYEECWDVNGQPTTWKTGPTWQLPSDFKILVFPPTAERQMWTYATCGMSCQVDAPPLEIHILSPTESDEHIELLTAVAHYHVTGDYIDVGHIVNFERPWLPDSDCNRGLVSLPYLDGPKLEWLVTGERNKVRFLWLIPISASEADFAKREGLNALEERFEASGFNYLDPFRAGVVDRKPQ